jgi:hypothetical protein
MPCAHPSLAKRSKIVVTSHSSNIQKGFDTMMWGDATNNLDFE